MNFSSVPPPCRLLSIDQNVPQYPRQLCKNRLFCTLWNVAKYYLIAHMLCLSSRGHGRWKDLFNGCDGLNCSFLKRFIGPYLWVALFELCRDTCHAKKIIICLRIFTVSLWVTFQIFVYWLIALYSKCARFRSPSLWFRRYSTIFLILIPASC